MAALHYDKVHCHNDHDQIINNRSTQILGFHILINEASISFSKMILGYPVAIVSVEDDCLLGCCTV
jgi:hypothetical protein